MLKITFVVIILLFSNHSYAGFLSTFFANVASDEFKNRNSTDPLINEKKIQASLGVMAFYQGKLDGDFNTFESRRGIKAFQKAYGLHATGFLNDREKSQLIYLSNLYTSLKYKGLQEKKRNLIYKEIDDTKNSLYSSKDRLKNLNTVYASSDIEDGLVYLDDKLVGKVTLGYISIKTNRTKGQIRITKITEDEEFIFKAKDSFELNDNKLTFINLVSQKQPSAKRLKKLQNKKNQEKMMQDQLWESDDVIIDNNLFLIWENMPKGKKRRRKTIQNAKAFCEDLEYAKRTDWRLPTLDEALSLMNNGTKVKDKPSEKWDSFSTAQTFFFYDYSTEKSGGIGSFDKGLKYNGAPAKTYEDNFKCVADFKNRDKLIAEKRKGDLTILKKDSLSESTHIDVKNRLLWDLSVRSANHKMSKIKCKLSKKDGLHNWRLPKQEELSLLYKDLPYYQKSWYAFWGFFIKSKEKYMFNSSSAEKIKHGEHSRYLCVHNL